MLKESDHLDILEVTFDSKMTYEKNLRSVSRAASQRRGILRKSWRVFQDILFLGRCFLGLVLPFWGAVDLFKIVCFEEVLPFLGTHLKLLDRVVSSTLFLTKGVFDYDIAHRRSVAILCMPYKIRTVVTRCTLFVVLYLCCLCQCELHAVLNLVERRYTYEPPRCRTSQYCRLWLPCQSLGGTICLTPYSMVWDCRVSRAWPMFFIGWNWSFNIVFYCFPCFSFLSIGWYCGAVVFGLIGCKSLYMNGIQLPCISDLFLIIIIILKNPKIFFPITIPASKWEVAPSEMPQFTCSSLTYVTIIPHNFPLPHMKNSNTPFKSHN